MRTPDILTATYVAVIVISVALWAVRWGKR